LITTPRVRAKIVGDFRGENPKNTKIKHRGNALFPLLQDLFAQRSLFKNNYTEQSIPPP